MESKPFVLLINGPIGAGKSTLANFLKKKLPPRTAFIDIEQIKFLFNCYKKSYFKIWLSKKRNQWYSKEARLVMIDLIKAYVNRGISVVVSSTWSLEYFSLLKKKIRNASLVHLMLQTSMENTFKRTKKRNGRVFPRRHKEKYDFDSKQYDKNTLIIDANDNILSVRQRALDKLSGKIF